MTPEGPVTWADPVSFNPNTQYKTDVMKGGRYPAIKYEVSGNHDFELTGADLEINVNMKR
jgi:hypothetical protein